MAKAESGSEKRRHPRVRVDKPVRAKAEGREHSGSLTDISAGGAALRVTAEIDEETEVELDIEDLRDLSGRVARVLDDGFAVEFELDEDEEDSLVAEIMGIHDAIRSEET
ncbi:MAG: PilZ domain-containing protein [Rhodospirillales bacterium]|jgi:hypothetical protein|nr:PilZ domain-containing protein [Rhodospirillales bacterium]